MKRTLPIALLLLAGALFFGCSSTSSMLSPDVLDEQIPLEQKFAMFDIPNVKMTYPSVYYDGLAWRDRLIELVREADDYIIASAFLASSSESLQELYDLIAEKARQGVRVYLVVDGIGPFDMTETRFHLIPLNYLKDSGVHLLEFNPLSATRLISLFNLGLRDHRKFLIIDGETVAVGGMNMNYISIGAPDENLQRDSMYEFRSPSLINVMLDHFVPWWNEQSWDELSRADFSVNEQAADGQELIDAYYVDQHPNSHKASLFYGSLIAEAKHEIKLLPFLPFFDKNMIESFKRASDRGVNITMLVPFDKRIGNRKGIEYMTKDLMKMGINLRIEEDLDENQRLLHEKLMIVDDRYVAVGSSNFNFRSLNLSYETVLLIDSPELAAQVEQHFDELYEKTIPITEEMAEKWHTWDGYPRYVFGFFGG